MFFTSYDKKSIIDILNEQGPLLHQLYGSIFKDDEFPNWQKIVDNITLDELVNRFKVFMSILKKVDVKVKKVSLSVVVDMINAIRSSGDKGQCRERAKTLGSGLEDLLELFGGENK